MILRGAPGGQFRWTDLRFPAGRDKQGQTQKPDYDFTNMGLLFPQNDDGEIVFITGQMPHESLLEGSLSPHIHFIQEVAQQPVFKIDYRIWGGGDNDALKSFTTITSNGFAYTWVSGDLAQIAKFPAISTVGIFTSVSGMFDMKIYRDDNVVSGDVLVKEFDVHYQIDDRGSRQEFIK